jgi:hypothetical protein
MHQRFAACGTVENQFYGFFERNPFTFGAVAVVEVMIFFVF